MPVTPYLFFDGRCEEALDFYTKVLGAEGAMLMRYKESPDPTPPGMLPPNSGDKIMHCEFKIKDTLLMASDGNCGGKPKFEGVALTYSAETPAEADRVFAALSEGGQVQMPLTKTFFSPSFGMLADKFGVSWMVIVPGPRPK
jgi:PhnB protein